MKKNRKITLNIPPEPLGLKLEMQKIFLSRAKTVAERKEWRECIKKTQQDIKKYGLFRKVKQR